MLTHQFAIFYVILYDSQEALRYAINFLTTKQKQKQKVLHQVVPL